MASGCLNTMAARSSAVAAFASFERQPFRDRDQLLFAIAMREPHEVRIAVGSASTGLTGVVRTLIRRRSATSINSTRLDLFQTRPPVVNSLVKPRAEDAPRAHHVERLEAGKPRQQIEVGDEQSRGIGDPVGDGDDDVLQTGRRGRTPGSDSSRSRSTCSSQAPLAATRRSYSRNAAARNRVCGSIRSAPRSPSSPSSAAVISSSNRFDLLRLPAQLIVEAQHLGDEPGTDLKRQCRPRRACRIVGRRLRDGVAVEGGQARAADSSRRA